MANDGNSPKFQFVAGNLALDFCNSMGGKREGIPREKLHSYFDLLSWAAQAGLIEEAARAALAEKARNDQARAMSVLSRALDLRETIYRIFAAVNERKGPSAADVRQLNVELEATLGRMRVVREKRVFAWGWDEERMDLDCMLGPIARSAAELLTDHHCLVRRCGGDNCGWLFVDSSKNHSRRWCDMRDCGNRAKVRRHRLKQRGME